MKYFGTLLFVLVSTAILFSSPAFSLTLDEKSLSELGFTGLELTQPSSTQCAPLTFTPFAGYAQDGNETVLTLHLETIPLSEADANIIITAPLLSTASDQLVIHPRDKLANGNVHVIIPPSWQTNTTTLNICAHSSLSTEKLTLSSQGMLGLYQQPHFDEKEDFKTYISGKNPQLGQEIEIQVYVHNSGAQPADVKIDYRKYNLDYIPLLKGETKYEGTIFPGEAKILTYKIKPLRSVQILLPPAVMTYENIFGETITQESTRAYLDVAAPAFNVRGAFLVPQTQVNENEPLTVRWVAQNEGITPLHGITAQFFVHPHGTITPTTFTINEMAPARAESREFTLTFSQAGKYELGCTIVSAQDPTLRTNCESATLDVVADTSWIAWAFSLLLLLIAIVVYAYIAILPNRPRAPELPKKRRFQS